MAQGHNMMDYEKEFSNFKWENLEFFNFAVDVVDKWAKDPEHLAMIWVDDHGHEIRKTFSDISCASKKLACMFAQKGIGRGNVIIMILPRNIEWWEIFTASLRNGSILSPGTTQLSEKDIEFRVNKSKATCVITDFENSDKFDAVRKKCPTVKMRIVIDRPKPGWLFYEEAMSCQSQDDIDIKTKSDDPCLVYFTSGTAGNPKMTLHTHGSYGLGHYVTGKYWLDLTSSDLHWNMSDTGWAKAAWSSYFGPWSMGAAIFVHHTDRFDPKKTLNLLSRYPVTTLCGAPTIYRMLVLEDLSVYDFSSLRHAVGAGEPLNPETIEIWKKATGTIIRDGYGQTETVLLCGSFPCLNPKFGSMGRPTPGIDLYVIDKEGNILPPGEEGDIAVRVIPNRPVGLFKEYWMDPEKTDAVFSKEWYVTGDRAYVDEEGYFWFVGRADDVIITAGYRIGPFEVESAIIEHPSVAESAVVSSPDETRGEVVKAFIILKPGFTASEELAEDIKNYVKRVTAPYKYPRKIEFVETLPKTVSGKIRRMELRKKEWGFTN